MGWWTDHVVPRMADLTLKSKEISELRARVCADLTGDIVEIGFGSGLNIPHYPPAVTSVDAVDPSGVGWVLARERVAASAVPIRRAGLDGQVVEAPAASYDAALSTFTLCTIPAVEMALTEVRRVLRPGGTFHFVEHGLAPSSRVARWQHRLNPLQKRLAGGCHLDRPIPRLVEAAGLTIEELTAEYLPGPAATHAFGYVYVGRARA